MDLFLSYLFFYDNQKNYFRRFAKTAGNGHFRFQTESRELEDVFVHSSDGFMDLSFGETFQTFQ